MDPLALLIVATPILSVVALFLSWERPFFQNRAFRIGLGSAFLLLTAFCLFGTLASVELDPADRLAWSLRYLTIGALTLSGALYFFLRPPVLSNQ